MSGRVDALADPALSSDSSVPPVADRSADDRSLAGQFVALVVSRSKGALAVSPAWPTVGTPVAENLAAHPTVHDRPSLKQHGQDIYGHRHHRLLVGLAVVLVFGLAGSGLVRALDGESSGGASPAGTLVSAEDESDQGEVGSLGQVVCWDGDVAPSLERCGSPSGVRGLAWVFPSLQPEACEAIGSVGRPQTWVCPVTIAGRDATIIYEQLFSVGDGIDHNNAIYLNGLGIRKTVGSRYVWKAKQRNAFGIWQFSSMYVTEPWAVRVESTSRKGVKHAFSSVEFRSPELQGVVATE